MDLREVLDWKAFKAKLEQNPNLHLQFRHAENEFVSSAYHITEIKQAAITSVDCGGVMNTWTETVVQLWEPQGEEQEKAMQVEKALSIISLVEKSLPLNPNGIVKIEFGNAEFDTRQMLPYTFIISGENLIVNLVADAVKCKAIERGGSCGTTESGEECCTPTVAKKPKLALKNLAVTADVCCTPGSGCC